MIGLRCGLRIGKGVQERCLKEDSDQGYAMQVLRLPAVGSKRFLTTKVDRCVTGVSAL